MAFSPDGKGLATVSFGPSGVKVWDAQTGEALLALQGHTHAIHRAAFSPDGKRLASGSGDTHGNGEVKVWDAQTGHELLTFQGGFFRHHVVFSPDGKRLASDAGGKVTIYDAAPLPEKP